MTDARYCRVTNASSMPWRLSRSKMCPRQGLLTIATIGFGRLIVSGLRRLPSPPAMTTACMRASLGAFRRLLGPDREEGFEVVTRVHLERHVRVGAYNAGDLTDASRDDVGELVVLARADHRDEVHRTRHRVDLGDAVDGGEGLAERRDGLALRSDEDDRGDHLRYRLFTSMSWSADLR